MRFMIPTSGKVPHVVGDSSYGKQKRTKARDQKAEEEEAVVFEPLAPSRPRLGPTGFQESNGSTGVPARAEILLGMIRAYSGSSATKRSKISAGSGRSV